jgi:hypothetical protein
MRAVIRVRRVASDFRLHPSMIHLVHTRLDVSDPHAVMERVLSYARQSQLYVTNDIHIFRLEHPGRAEGRFDPVAGEAWHMSSNWYGNQFRDQTQWACQLVLDLLAIFVPHTWHTKRYTHPNGSTTARHVSSTGTCMYSMRVEAPPPGGFADNKSGWAAHLAGDLTKFWLSGWAPLLHMS